MRVLKIIGLISLCITYTLNAQEIRLGAAADYKITKKVKTNFQFQQRFSEHNMRSQSSQLIQTKVNYKQNKHFSYSLAFRYKRENDFNGEMRDKNSDKMRFTTDVKVKIPDPIKHVTVYNRLRFQETYRADSKSWFLIRNQLSAKYKYSKVLSNSMSFELFYNARSNALELARTRFKIDHQLTKKFAISAYFMIDAPLANKKFDHFYVVGTHLLYKI